MAYPIAATSYPNPPGNIVANPAYTGIFIPEIWSGKMIEKFYNATVLGAIANTDWEGDIRNMGDTVHIRTKPSITINDYEADQILTPERPSSALVDLQIDKGKYWNTVLDDVMEVQSDMNLMSMWADDASEQMKIAIDTDVLANIVGDFDASNLGTAAGAISGNVNLGATTTPVNLVDRGATAPDVEIIDMITRFGQVLDEQNVPETGRWIVMPAWAAAMLKRSELRDASLTGDGQTVLRNGRLGMVDRFTLYVSNLLPFGVAASLQAGEWYIFAGHSHGLTFASQLTKMETLRAESTFGTLMRGLQVYGYKVVDGVALAAAVVTAT